MTKPATPTACRECDDLTTFAVCNNCGWAVCRKDAKKRRSPRLVNGVHVVDKTCPFTHHVCPQCEQEGF